jgi:hypothetical protein
LVPPSPSNGSPPASPDPASAGGNGTQHLGVVHVQTEYVDHLGNVDRLRLPLNPDAADAAPVHVGLVAIARMDLVSANVPHADMAIADVDEIHASSA